MDQITILIADDHALFRKGMRKLLEGEEDLLVVGEAATGREARTCARALMPDIILMDIKMPDLDGVEAARILHSEMPHVGIIFCTAFDDAEFVFAALKAGGRGYVVKDADPETILRAIRAVAHGESLLSPTVAEKVLHYFAAQPAGAPSGGLPFCDDLSEREREVLVLLGNGHSNAEIADLLSISVKTVKNHIGNIFSKLHVKDRTQAMLYAIRKGLVQI